MNKNGLWMLGVAMTLSIIMGCSHTDYRQVAGTLDGPLPADTAPQICKHKFMQPLLTAS